ncbi:hypothetical protein ACG02S_10610 [Roseateles sp. DC23W]|uniref:Uncharacterized protein n=1 Tax=Pelomonas dachongensis TaxID=3299029 RepID=A0ABW7ELI2_9BURK
MSGNTGSKVWRTVVISLLMMGTLGFGLASLCGTIFTAIGVAGVTSEQRDPYAMAIFVFSVPSLLIGGGLAWWCVSALRKRLHDDKPPSA